MNNSKYTRIGDENEESESKNDCVTDIVKPKIVLVWVRVRVW